MGFLRAFHGTTLLARRARHFAVRIVERVSAVFGERLTLLAIARFLVANDLRTRGVTSALARASAIQPTHSTHFDGTRRKPRFRRGTEDSQIFVEVVSIVYQRKSRATQIHGLNYIY